jgi:hypothetical protein
LVVAGLCKLRVVSLEPLVQDVWTARAPFRFLSFAIGNRMTVVRLPDGGVLLHSPIAIDDTLRAEIDKIGPVRHIVAPNLFHHLFVRPAMQAYPEAKLHAVPELAKKRPDLRIDHTLGESTWDGAITTVTIPGTMLRETVLFHAPSGTLISADLLEYFERCDEAWTRTYLKAAGVYQKATWNRLLRFLYRDRKAARPAIDKLLELPIERITISHGDNITTDARGALRNGFAWL